LKTSTKKFIKKFDEESLFNILTELSNMIMMNSFEQDQDESSKSEESQADLRSELSSFKITSQ